MQKNKRNQGIKYIIKIRKYNNKFNPFYLVKNN